MIPPAFPYFAYIINAGHTALSTRLRLPQGAGRHSQSSRGHFNPTASREGRCLPWPKTTVEAL